MKLVKPTHRMHCRWCGNAYYAEQPHDRDGCCCAAHKQALHRARKKVVTTAGPAAAARQKPAVTKKKAKAKHGTGKTGRGNS